MQAFLANKTAHTLCAHNVMLVVVSVLIWVLVMTLADPPRKTSLATS